MPNIKKPPPKEKLEEWNVGIMEEWNDKDTEE